MANWMDELDGRTGWTNWTAGISEIDADETIDYVSKPLFRTKEPDDTFESCHSATCHLFTDGAKDRCVL